MSLAKTSNLGAPENKTQKAPAKFASWRFQRNLTPYLFLSPFLLAFIVFMVYPLLYALNLSLYRKKIVGGVSFVGLDNYVKAFHDGNFWEGVRNVLVFGAMQIPVMLGFASLFALL